MQFLRKQWPSHAFRFGGSSGRSQAQQISQAPTPLPAPPITQSNDAVIQAQNELAQQALGKKSVRKTIIAGDTGGWKAGADKAFGNMPPAGKV